MIQLDVQQTVSLKDKPIHPTGNARNYNNIYLEKTVATATNAIRKHEEKIGLSEMKINQSMLFEVDMAMKTSARILNQIKTENQKN